MQPAFTPVVYFIVLFNLKPFSYCYITIHIMSCQQVILLFVHIYFTFILFFRHSNGFYRFNSATDSLMIRVGVTFCTSGTSFPPILSNAVSTKSFPNAS